MEVRELNKDDVLFFILKNKDNKALMAELNRITYAFTAKYENGKQGKNKAEDDVAKAMSCVDIIQRNTRKYPLGKIMSSVSKYLLEHKFNSDVYELENFLWGVSNLVENYSEYDIRNYYPTTYGDETPNAMKLISSINIEGWNEKDEVGKLMMIFEFLEGKYLVKTLTFEELKDAID